MESEIQQLVEMGASVAQARAALKQYKDVMQAAERIFDGKFDHVQEEDNAMESGVSASRAAPRMVTPDDEEDEEDDEGMAQEDYDDEANDYVDYDSDYESKAARNGALNADPYAGIFFSKDRREEVIEVEEDPETVSMPEIAERVKIMTQGQWMKGCPEGGEQSFLFSLYSELSEGTWKCPHDCGSSVIRRKSDFFALYPEFSTFIGHVRTIVRRKCSRCSKEFCFACGEPVTVDKARRPSAAADDPMFHCSNLQGVILGVGLSMLEQMFVEQTLDATGGDESKARITKKRKTDKVSAAATSTAFEDAEDEDDVYYAPVKGKKSKGGIGYAGNQREDTTGQAEALAVQRLKDERIGKLLSDIRVYLPSLKRPGGGQTSDYLVHPATLAHLRRRFNAVSSALLRNDSLADMSDRSVLYFELFEWLETISNHEALASMMAMPIMVPVTIKPFAAKKDQRGRPQIRERTVIYEGSSGPRELLEAIVIQARAALKGLEGVKPHDVTPEQMTEEQKRMTYDDKGKGKERELVFPDENAKLLKFCQRILATALAIDRSLSETKGDRFVERLHASLPMIPTSSDAVYVDAGTTEEDAKKAYIEWATRVRFEYCDLSIPVMKDGKVDEESPPNYKFYYNNEARMLANSDIPKRSLAIAKELAVLTTNLPVAWDSSIFLRVDETRVDVIKALITGPEGTPYYNGCYLFDIHLGPSYNQTPPSVKYMTTNGGKFRFNPNLYADGKVCLSLLGTWQGPGWISGKSTLLQVLISIQSMILCEEPYLNEPGWATSGGTPQSNAYSANVRRMVVNTAMLGNLKNPPEPWEEVIRTHYRLKARSIIKQLDQWLAQDDGKQTTTDGGGYGGLKADAQGSSVTTFQRDVEEMKRLLNRLQGTGSSSSAKDAAMEVVG